MAWETEDELVTAWLGGYGPEEEAEAEEFVQECLDGKRGGDVQVLAQQVMDGLGTYIEEGRPMGEELVAELQAQEGDEDQGDVAAAAERMRAVDDHATAVLAAELENFADHVKGGRPLTQGEVDELMSRVPVQAIEGGVVPNLVAGFGDEFKEKWSTPAHREQAQEEVGRAMMRDQEHGFADDEADVETSEQTVDRSDPEARLELMARAGAAAMAGDGAGNSEGGGVE
jgi:hypothetical protein